MNFKAWLQEVEYHNFGVPVYADPATPAIRPDFLLAPGVSNAENPLGDSPQTLHNIRDRRQNVVKRFGLGSYKQLPGHEFITGTHKPGVIKTASELGIKTDLLGKHKSMSWFDAMNVSDIKPCDRCYTGPSLN